MAIKTQVGPAARTNVCVSVSSIHCRVEKIKHEKKTTKMLRTGERPSEWTTKFRHTKGLGEHLLGSLFGYSKTEGRLMISVGIKLLVAFEKSGKT